ncbi:MAG: N-acetyl-gamma-glutamyl-phosphate reductase [Planctomycetes bacterium]|nr:N-acetyl-gamma-glutamyl-phosphate reductase [Planctomycetota bacterium]
MKKRIAVVGAAGYSGAELLEILLAHDGVEIVGLFGSARRDKQGATQGFDEVFTRFRDRLTLPLQAFDVDACAALKPDVVFLATPNEASTELAPGLVAKGLRVLDLSGSFRLKDSSLYPKYYGFEHPDTGLLAKSIYGQPETNRNAIASAQMVAVPGCYATAAILALSPLGKAGIIKQGTRAIVDAISGVSGAGRSLNQRSLFCEVSVQAYGVLTHRHTPEIEAYSGVRTVFTPHLGPYDRGILATIHIDTAPDITAQRVRDIYHTAYDNEPFVRLLKTGNWPSVADVRGTNFCDIGFAMDEANGHLIICSAIDNLVKGAAGQAVQCMNLCLGFRESNGMASKSGSGVSR